MELPTFKVNVEVCYSLADLNKILELINNDLQQYVLIKDDNISKQLQEIKLLVLEEIKSKFSKN